MFAFLQRKKNRKRNPKGYGYCVYAEFGPALRIDRHPRLVAKFPAVSASEIATWISDYEQVSKAVWQVAEAGGAAHNSREEIAHFLLLRFPWLKGEGLQTAMSRSDYFAWHEGFHESPRTTLAEQVDADQPTAADDLKPE